MLQLESSYLVWCIPERECHSGNATILGGNSYRNKILFIYFFVETNSYFTFNKLSLFIKMGKAAIFKGCSSYFIKYTWFPPFCYSHFHFLKICFQVDM